MLGGLGFGSVVPQPSSVVRREKLAAFDSGINSESTVPARSRARGCCSSLGAWSLACGIVGTSFVGEASYEQQMFCYNRLC